MAILKAIILLFSLIFVSQSYKVVIFVPTLANSQLVFNYRIGDLLASAGHDVTMYRPQYNPDALKGSSNLTKEIRTNACRDPAIHREMEENIGEYAFGDGTIDMSLAFKFMDMLKNGCEMQISNKKLMEQLAAEKFDIAIVHMYDFCPLGMVHALKIPTHIWMSSGIFHDFMAWFAGVPTPVSYVPSELVASGDRMTYFERMKNFLSFCMLLPEMIYMILKPETELFRQYYGQDFPGLDTLARKSPLLFVNSVELIDFPRPVLHKVVYIGGIGMKEPKQLEDKWQTLMDNSADGVVLLSMGSVVNSTQMPYKLRMSFLKAFSNFPTYTFIWKYEDPNFTEAKQYKNVHLSSWVPQLDLFGHPKFKAFITHGGYNSFQEAAHAGIPLISMPLFADQYGNTKRAEKHGIGIGLDKLKLSEKTLTIALKKVLFDPSYLKNAKRVGSMLRKKPIKSEDLAVRWVEFLAEYQELPNLEPAGNDLNLIQYFSVDVILGLCSGMFLSVYLFYRIVYWCFRSLRAMMSRNKKKLE